MGTKITAVILNYKNLTDTLNCLRSIKETDLGKKISYLVVDNSPIPKNKKILAEKFPETEYLASPKNLGFAGGNNLGIKKALLDGADFVLIVNPDVLVPRIFFKTLIKNFKDKDVGIVAPAIAHKQKGRLMYGLEGSVDWARAKKHHREENRIHTEERNFGLLLAGNARNLQSMPSLLPDKDVPEWLVQVNSNHTVPTRFATFAHELGHIFCGHCGAHLTGKWPNRSSLSYAIKETEAEAVSYLVCARQGLTVASQEYLSELIRDVDLVNISLYSIFEAANRVEGKLFSGA